MLEELIWELDHLLLVLWLAGMSNQLISVSVLWFIPLPCLSAAVFTDIWGCLSKPATVGQ